MKRCGQWLTWITLLHLHHQREAETDKRSMPGIIWLKLVIKTSEHNYHDKNKLNKHKFSQCRGLARTFTFSQQSLQMDFLKIIAHANNVSNLLPILVIKWYIILLVTETVMFHEFRFINWISFKSFSRRQGILN